MTNSLGTAIERLNSLKEETSRHVQERIDEIIMILSSNDKQSLRINKALQKIETIADENGIQSDARMQLFNIVSLLESV